MKTFIKILALLLVLALIGGVISWRIGVLPFGAAKQVVVAPPPPSVSVAAALEMPVTEWDEFSGRIEAIDHVEIRPRVSGTIDMVHFQDGQLVNKGDLLFTIDPRPFQAELARTQAVLAGAQAHVALAVTNFNRSKQLITTHAIAQNQFDQDYDSFMEANASLQAAQAAVQAAQLNLNYTAIVAPVTGRVSRAEITVGNLVEAGSTPPLLTTIVSVSPVYVEFEIDEQSYLKYLANGAYGNSGVDHIPVSMGLANEDGYPHQGHIESIDNQLDTSSGTIRVRATFDNSTGELTPGLYAKVRTGGSAAQDSVLVDDRAIGTDQDKKYVMVIDDKNKATYRTVTLGPMVNGLRIVRTGLARGERIVVNGLQRVQPNEIVNPVTTAMNGENSTSDTTPLTASNK